MLDFPRTYAVYDFETTGLDPYKCNVIEIGCKLVAGSSVQIHSWLVKPPEPITDDITRLTGITNQDLAAGREPKDAFAEFFALLGRSRPLIGHNIVRYDSIILKRMFNTFCGFDADVLHCVDMAALYKGRAMRMQQQWHETHLDFARRILELRAPIKYNLTAACNAMNIDISDLAAHRAAGDVEATDRLYRKLVGLPVIEDVFI